MKRSKKRTKTTSPVKKAPSRDQDELGDDELDKVSGGTSKKIKLPPLKTTKEIVP